MHSRRLTWYPGLAIKKSGEEEQTNIMIIRTEVSTTICQIYLRVHRLQYSQVRGCSIIGLLSKATSLTTPTKALFFLQQLTLKEILLIGEPKLKRSTQCHRSLSNTCQGTSSRQGTNRLSTLRPHTVTARVSLCSHRPQAT